MGVPAFFRWLERQCVDITNYCVEGDVSIDPETGRKIYGDTSKPNPNDIEFDNLYLDMNGIIHPCSHPEDRPAPRNEDEIMVCIFDSIDRIFNICRPRKLLYMAIDGVAPRAKMNQQRSRRFRASKESMISHDTKDQLMQELVNRGCKLPQKDPKKMRFDSNCITPGTTFMNKLADCLRFYIYDRLTNYPGWRNVKIILSDASVPGEGEHKIMDYVRKQRAVTGHDPNTRHVICGADADLIMLGLATHEPNFTIIRDEFVPGKPSPCAICGKMDHAMEDCLGLNADEDGPPEAIFAETKYIFIHIKIIREWLELEMHLENPPFKWDIENLIDDWVLLCFFVGNDFLPHLPSLEIREGAINKLVNIYKDCLITKKGYMTKNGKFDLSKVEFIMQNIGQVEDEIFRNRNKKEQMFKNRNKRDRENKKKQKEAIKNFGETDNVVQIGKNIQHSQKTLAYIQQVRAKQKSTPSPIADSIREKKQKQEENDPEDNVMLHESGWKERYYQSKFNVSSNDIAFKRDLVRCYTEGLAWVLGYYYQGCQSWNWYFPYHYAPFASDIKDISKICIEWPITIPRRPLEQLMCVFPAGSKEFLPKSWAELMCTDRSPIIDFYPTDFKLDLNGKRFEWMGVALLPFVDEDRLKRTLTKVYPNLTNDEISRNTRGENYLFISKFHHLFKNFSSNNEKRGTFKSITFGKGFSGKYSVDEKQPKNMDTFYKSPIPEELEGLKKVSALSVCYRDMDFDQTHIFIPKLLPGAKLPPKVGLTAKFSRGGKLYSKPSDYRRDPKRLNNDISSSQNRMITNSFQSNRPNTGYNSRGAYMNNQSNSNRFSSTSSGPIRTNNANFNNGTQNRAHPYNPTYNQNPTNNQNLTNYQNPINYQNLNQNQNFIPMMNTHANQFFNMPNQNANFQIQNNPQMGQNTNTQQNNVPMYNRFNMDGVNGAQPMANRNNSGNARGGSSRGRGNRRNRF